MHKSSHFNFKNVKQRLATILSLFMLFSLAGYFGPSHANAAAADLLSFRKPVLASSSEGDNTTDRAVDGNISSRWASVWQMNPQWIYVDLGSVANINRVYLSWEAAYAKEFKIQVSSDADTWKDLYSTANGTGGVNDLTNLSGTGRYVRVYCTQRALADFGYSLYEFQVYGQFTTSQPPTPVNIALNKPVTASTWEVPIWSTDPGIVSAVKANDGDYTTRWSSESWDPQYISIDLGSVHTIGTVVLNWESAYGKSYDIQVSNDGKSWTTVYRQLYGRGGVETIKLKADGRYVKMDGFARGTSFGYSLYEFEIYDFVNGDPVPPVHIPDKPVPQIVNVGAGSYKTNDITTTTPTYPEYKTANVTGPLPSGGWWQSILIKRLSDGLVALPLRTQYTDQGLSVMNPGAGFMSPDGKTNSTAGAPDFYLMANNINPLNMAAKVDGYGDYSVRAVLSDDNTFKMKTTLVKGSPYIFNEFTDGNSPYLVLSGTSTRFFDNNNATILAANGSSITADHIGVEVANVDSGGNAKTRSYGLFAPAGTVFTRDGGKLKIQLGSQEKYLSIGTLPANNLLNYYYQHAYAFVTDTKADYNVQDEKGTVTTTYNSTVQLKRSGFSSESLMALLPNQWKSTTSATSLSPYTYPSVRGTMKVHEGNTFFTENKFTGIIPQFAEPTGSSSYNRAEVIGYLNSMNQMLENNYMWDDPYWEGKNLQPLAQGITIADQLGETAIRDKSLSILKNILTNWFTYSGGWPNDYPYYLYYTPEWGAMQGDGGDHGMAKWMSDHHYVWGYYIYAASILGTYDKDFVNQYGGMVEHLIRDVGNPSRTDSMYPYMRAFDPYEGVSWAGGYGDSYDGNNQEATSEALFAYAGEYLWGMLTNNKAYRDAGMWVYAVETNSVMQYWFNYDQDNWLPGYNHGIVGQVYGSKNYYGTYFAAAADNIYGIQLLPTAPYMSYLGLRPDAAARTYNAFKADKGGPETGWYHIIWPFEALSNPQDALSKWDPNKIASDDNNGKKEWANTYWFLNAMNAFGTRTTDLWSSNWSAYQVFKKNGTYTANIWNPTDVTQNVVFRNAAGDVVGTVTVPPKKTVAANPVNGSQPPNNGEQVAIPTFNPAGGTFTSAQTVQISSTTQGAVIRYTVDGSTPTASSGIVYTGPFTVSATTTVKAIAYKQGMSDSAVNSAVFTITTGAGGTNVALGKTATASSALGGNTASAAFDGDASTRWESNYNETEYIQVDLGSSYRITGVKLNWETAAGKDYKIQVSSDKNTWVDAYTRTGGSGGIENITFNNPVTGRYIQMSGTARTTGYGYSLWEFEVYGSPAANQAAAPEFSPAGGVFTSAQTVTLTSATPGAVIKYTTDGTAPGANSPTYSGPITISGTTVIKAIAVKSGMADSPVASSTYTINQTSGSPIPGKIEAESYTAMNGIETEECSEGTRNISYTDAGDWMDYTVTVPAAGTYTVEFRVASPYNNTQLQLMKDSAVLTTITVPNTGSFQTWQTVSANVTLSAGTQTLRVYGVTNGWNFNYMNFL